MQNGQDDTFKSTSRFDRHLEGQLCGRGYDIRVNELQWPDPGEAILTPNTACFLELIFNPDSTWEGQYLDMDTDGGFRDLGSMLFVPPGHSLRCRWTAGRQRAVGCLFDLEAFGALHGLDWNWAAVDLENTFDIDNPFLLAALRRLGEEAVAPSFASELQSDCTLVLLALELRRHFFGVETEEKPRVGKLSHRQMSLVNEVIDSAVGVGPTLEDLAQACNMPARQLSASIKRMSGMTLRNYVASARVKKAQHLLADTSLMIKQVAYQCGFKQAAAFTAAFRKETGSTPQEFRELHAVSHRTDEHELAL